MLYMQIKGGGERDIPKKKKLLELVMNTTTRKAIYIYSTAVGLVCVCVCVYIYSTAVGLVYIYIYIFSNTFF